MIIATATMLLLSVGLTAGALFWLLLRRRSCGRLIAADFETVLLVVPRGVDSSSAYRSVGQVLELGSASFAGLAPCPQTPEFSSLAPSQFSLVALAVHKTAQVITAFPMIRMPTASIATAAAAPPPIPTTSQLIKSSRETSPPSISSLVI